MIKKIHFISLRDCYSFHSLGLWRPHRFFTELIDMIPDTTCYLIGPVFTSVSEAHEIAYDAFRIIADKKLKSATPGKGPYDVDFGSKKSKKDLVSRELLDNISSYRWFNQIRNSIGDYDN
ncbi:MAG TPA: hypothetical protein VMD74_03340, partial [Candidatus Methylomirabilis sp.]|nr:hypothetical protein [Candidatus Methylomirabilis sp.]